MQWKKEEYKKDEDENHGEWGKQKRERKKKNIIKFSMMRTSLLFLWQLAARFLLINYAFLAAKWK